MENGDTYSHLFETLSVSCPHPFLLVPYITYFLNSHCYFPSSSSAAADSPSCGNPCWLVATEHNTHTDTPADVLKLCQIRHGGEAVAVSQSSDWTAPQRRRKTNHSQLSSLTSKHVTGCRVLNTRAVKEKKRWGTERAGERGARGKEKGAQQQWEGELDAEKGKTRGSKSWEKTWKSIKGWPSNEMWSSWDVTEWP